MGIIINLSPNQTHTNMVELEVEVDLEIEVEVEAPEVEVEVDLGGGLEVEIGGDAEVEVEVEVEVEPEVEVEVEGDVEIEVELNAPTLDMELGGNVKAKMLEKAQGRACSPSDCCAFTACLVFMGGLALISMLVGMQTRSVKDTWGQYVLVAVPILGVGLLGMIFCMLTGAARAKEQAEFKATIEV